MTAHSRFPAGCPPQSFDCVFAPLITLRIWVSVTGILCSAFSPFQLYSLHFCRLESRSTSAGASPDWCISGAGRIVGRAARVVRASSFRWSWGSSGLPVLFRSHRACSPTMLPLMRKLRIVWMTWRSLTDASLHRLRPIWFFSNTTSTVLLLRKLPVYLTRSLICSLAVHGVDKVRLRGAWKCCLNEY